MPSILWIFNIKNLWYSLTENLHYHYNDYREGKWNKFTYFKVISLPILTLAMLGILYRIYLSLSSNNRDNNGNPLHSNAQRPDIGLGTRPFNQNPDTTTNNTGNYQQLEDPNTNDPVNSEEIFESIAREKERKDKIKIKNINLDLESTLREELEEEVRLKYDMPGSDNPYKNSKEDPMLQFQSIYLLNLIVTHCKWLIQNKNPLLLNYDWDENNLLHRVDNRIDNQELIRIDNVLRDSKIKSRFNIMSNSNELKKKREIIYLNTSTLSEKTDYESVWIEFNCIASIMQILTRNRGDTDENRKVNDMMITWEEKVREIMRQKLSENELKSLISELKNEDQDDSKDQDGSEDEEDEDNDSSASSFDIDDENTWKNEQSDSVEGTLIFKKYRSSKYIAIFLSSENIKLLRWIMNRYTDIINNRKPLDDVSITPNNTQDDARNLMGNLCETNTYTNQPTLNLNIQEQDKKLGDQKPRKLLFKLVEEKINIGIQYLGEPSSGEHNRLLNEHLSYFKSVFGIKNRKSDLTEANRFRIFLRAIKDVVRGTHHILKSGWDDTDDDLVYLKEYCTKRDSNRGNNGNKSTEDEISASNSALPDLPEQEVRDDTVPSTMTAPSLSNMPIMGSHLQPPTSPSMDTDTLQDAMPAVSESHDLST